jgi:hypothetical protein
MRWRRLRDVNAMKSRALRVVFDRAIQPRLHEFIRPNLVVLEYPLHQRARWGYDAPTHPELEQLIAAGRDSYGDLLRSFYDFEEPLSRISAADKDGASSTPRWCNGWFDALDAIALYSLLAQRKPKNYVEIGSGMSTKFARRAIRDFDLDTRITSIDPEPRAEVDAICDSMIRDALENVGDVVVETANSGDLVFFDGSHRTFMNSDVTVMYLEVLPRLKPGVLVHAHDIFLPADYPPGWEDRYYSEQYLLGAYLLGGSRRLRTLLPNAFISWDPDLRRIAEGIVGDPNVWRVGGYLAKTTCLGSSFWSEIVGLSRDG